MARGIRVQLQEQRGGRTIHYGSEVIEGDDVSAAQVVAALRRLRDLGVVPEREATAAEAALGRAIRWVEARPPHGVSGRWSKSFYVSPEKPATSWRFDIEGLQGEHLHR